MLGAQPPAEPLTLGREHGGFGDPEPCTPSVLTPTEGAQDAADSQAEEHELLGGTNQGLGSSSTHLSPAPAGAAGELQHHESPAGRSMLIQGGAASPHPQQ